MPTPKILALVLPFVLAATVTCRLSNSGATVIAPPATGVLDIYEGALLKARFIEVSTLHASANSGSCSSRVACGFGRGVLDKNHNFQRDRSEQEQVFDIGSYGTSYLYYENPLQPSHEPADWNFHEDGSSS